MSQLLDDGARLFQLLQSHAAHAAPKVYPLSIDDMIEIVRLLLQWPQRVCMPVYGPFTAETRLFEFAGSNDRMAAMLSRDQTLAVIHFNEIDQGVAVKALALCLNDAGQYARMPSGRAGNAANITQSLHRIAGRFLPGLSVCEPDQRFLAAMLPEHCSHALTYRFSASPDEVGDAAAAVFRRMSRTRSRYIDKRIGMAEIGERVPSDEPGIRDSEYFYQVRWNPQSHGHGTDVGWVVRQDCRMPHNEATMFKSLHFGHELGAELGRRALRPPSEPPLRYVVKGPGEAARRPGEFVVRDFSGLATADELNDLRDGDLPLGQYAFGKTQDEVVRGPLLFLNREQIARGAVICAPPGAGKTELLMRWAIAARQRGYSIFIIDIKGNMLKKFGANLGQGEEGFYYFSTSADDPSDHLNLLDDLLWTPPCCGPDMDCDRLRHAAHAQLSSSVNEVVDALLTIKGFTEGQEQDFYRNRVKWLRAFIYVLKLLEFYGGKKEFPGRSADIIDLIELIENEKRFHECLAIIRNCERTIAARHQEWQSIQQRFGAASLTPAQAADFRLQQAELSKYSDMWRRRPVYDSTRALTDLRILINAPKLFPTYSGMPKDQNYASLTNNMLGALQPFRDQLYMCVRDQGSGRKIRLKDVFLGPKPATLLFAGSGSDNIVTGPVLSFLVRRILRLVETRMKLGVQEPPMLLLLDETNSIPEFDANLYAKTMRESKAACVLVYQDRDLPQSGWNDKFKSLLVNVGVNIFVGSLTTDSAKAVIETTPQRRDLKYSGGQQQGFDGGATSTQHTEELKDTFSTAELCDLPAGKYPAFVRLNAQPPRKPFLVDMDNKGPVQVTITLPVRKR